MLILFVLALVVATSLFGIVVPAIVYGIWQIVNAIMAYPAETLNVLFYTLVILGATSIVALTPYFLLKILPKRFWRSKMYQLICLWKKSIKEKTCFFIQWT